MRGRWKLLPFLLALLLLSGCGRDQAGGTAGVGSLEELPHAKIGIATGSSFAGVREEYLPGSTAEYYNNYPDMITALQSGKVGVFLADEPIARELSRNAEGITWLTPPITTDNYAFILAPEDEALAVQVDQVLERLRADGTLKTMDKKWFEGAEAEKVLPELSLTGEKGALRVATNSGPPFSVSSRTGSWRATTPTCLLRSPTGWAMAWSSAIWSSSPFFPLWPPARRILPPVASP